MSSIALSSIISLYAFPTGRRIFAFGQVAAVAKTQGFPELAKHCAGAIVDDRACLALEKRWGGMVAAAKGKAPSTPAGGDARLDAAGIDPLVDKTLTAIRDHAVNQTAGAAPGDPIHATVAAFLTAIFPSGVQQVTGLPFIEELAAVDLIVTALQSKDVAPVVKELGLGRLSKRLGDLAVLYREALEAPAPETIAFGDVRAARIKGQELLLETVAIAIGKHHSNSAEDIASRSALLAPIFEQNDAIAAALRGRRALVDVNPETGAADPSAPVAAIPAEAPAGTEGRVGNG